MKSVFIALPAFGHTNSSKTTASLMALAKVLLANGYDYYFVDQSLPDIVDLRNILTTIWYDKTKADHLLFVDADMAFEPQLVMDMLAFDKPVVGALYPQKRLPIRFVAKLHDSRPLPVNNHLQVDGVGGGVLLVRRGCLDSLLESGAAKSDDRIAFHASGSTLQKLGVTRMIRAFDKIETERGALSEDYSFCRRYVDIGGEIWANIGHPITHIGDYGYTGRFADVMERRDG